jgi:hypothetical protein
MTRRLLAVLFVTAVAFALTVRAEDPSAKSADPKKPDAPALDSKAEQDLAAAKEKLLREEFETFKNEVLKLKQRLETSDKDEDKATVKVLDSVLKEINNLAVDGQFDKMIESLQDPKTFKAFQNASDIEAGNKELHVAMLKLIDLLQSGDDFKESRKKIEANLRLLEKLREIRSIQERQNAQIDRPNKSGRDLSKVQQRLVDETKKTLDPNAGAGKKADFKKSEAKYDNKPGSDAKGEAKNDAQRPKGEAKADKPGDNKDGKPGEAKASETKDDKKPGEGKAGEAKDAKPGESKDGKPSDGKAGESKEGGKPKDGKAGEAKDNKGDAKPGEGKGNEAKPGEAKGAKPGEGKEGKPGEGKPGESKSGKPGEGKPSESKSGSDSKGQKEGKGESKPGAGKGEAKAGESKGKPSAGQPGQSQPGQGKGESSESASSSPPPPAGPQMKQPVRKKIEDGVKDMEETKKKLDAENKKDALPAGEKAADDISKAIKNLEEIINADRQEEIERILERLQARCARMLAMQIAVKDGTVKLDEKLQEVRRSKGDERPLALDSNVLSDREYDIVKEADRALALLENDGSAIAFAEMFQMVRKDMLTVKARLAQTDTGAVTTGVEDEIIKNLTDMVEALKKQREANKSKGQKPPPPGPPKPPGEDPLVDLIAQLKLLRSMQKGLNSRTGLYAREYRGEQAPAPDSAKNSKERSHYEMIQKEMKELAETEAKISKILKDMLTGKNRVD